MSSRGRGRGSRGGSSAPRGGRGRGGAPPMGTPVVSSHIQTVGVRRPDFGSSGRSLPIFVNSFVTTIPDGLIYHYDGEWL